MGAMVTTATLTPAALFYTNGKGWFVSTRTHCGFRHTKVAGPSASRPSDGELAAKGFEVQS